MKWKTTPSRSCECIGLNGFVIAFSGPQKRARGPLPARGALLWPPLLLSKIQLEKRELKPNTMWNKGLLFSELGLDDFITSTCQRSTWGHGRRAETLNELDKLWVITEYPEKKKTRYIAQWDEDSKIFTVTIRLHKGITTMALYSSCVFVFSGGWRASWGFG